jgi:ABC-type multidrug transport system ATPase subunit
VHTGELRLRNVAIGDLSAIDLTVGPGEIVCLSGPSGAGKSRLLRAIADLEPHGGDVALGSTAQAAVPAHEWRRAVMLVPADSQWWLDRAGEHFEQPMPEAIEAVGLDPAAADWPVSRLSTGEKQRLALVRALSCGPAALLLDEPTANLDEDTTLRVERWLTGLIAEHRLPTLWIAHSLEQIRRVADRHMAITGGTLEARP